MAHHFYLPQLSGENISVPKEKAHWNNNDKKIILQISDSITVGEKEITRGVSSIPDIWARPLLFQSALRNQQHPLHKECVQEWRGLMSILALHKIKPELKNIQIVPIILDEGTLCTALNNLVPSPVQLEKGVEYLWTDILMIRYDNIPLGAFSPTTLVYSGTDYQEKLKSIAFPFKDENGYLIPPLTKKDGLEALGEWLDSIRIQLNEIFYSDQQNPDHLTIGNINYLLESWLKEIRETLGLSGTSTIDTKKYKVDEEVSETTTPTQIINDCKIYEKLLHPLKKEDNADQEDVSDILLNFERNYSGFSKVIVITEKLLSSDINIWEGIQPKALGTNAKLIIEKYFNAAWGTKINNVDLEDKGVIWIRPELFFISDNLLKAKSGNYLVDEESFLNNGSKYIVPLKREILNYFSAVDIEQKLKLYYREDENLVRFSFMLPVNGTIEKIEKVFRLKAVVPSEGEIIESEPPVIELFPNYLGMNWRRYYLFQGMANELKTTPIVFGKDIVLFENERDDINTKFPQKIRMVEISGDDCFPEAIEVHNPKGKSQGLIFVSKKESKQGLKDSWVIGIDYGTSNSNVYKKREDANLAERWTYNFPKYLRPLTNSNPELRKAIVEEYLFPTSDITLPIPTTLKVYDKARLRSGTLMLDYFLYIPQESFKFPDYVLSDIKWEDEGESKTKYYLEGILLLVLIEAVAQNVNKIKLVCSFPKAFSTDNEIAYKNAWQGIFKKLLDNNNPSRVLNKNREDKTQDQGVRMAVVEPIFQTEGDAAGEYFASESTIQDIRNRANKEKASICLDIGGGTSDISLWYENKIEFDTSVLLAGRQISSFIQKNRRIREKLFSKEAAIALEEKEKEPTYFSARLNLILKREESKIQEKLGDLVHDKDLKWLRQIIELEFGALAYYSALVCLSTNDRVIKQTKLADHIRESGISLHWGGNAAKLISWIDFGDQDGKEAKAFLNAIFFNALSNKSNGQKTIKPSFIGQFQSPEHKCEAAGGLVVMNLNGNSEFHHSSNTNENAMEDYEMPDLNSEQTPNYAGTICGENIVMADGKIDHLKALTMKDLYENNSKKFKASTFEKLDHFLEVFNFFGVKNGLFTEDMKLVLTEADRRIINDGLFKQFSSMEKMQEGQRQIESIFIMQIKILMEIIKSKMN